MTATLPWAVVPVKAFAQAKQRLAPLLDPGERTALARAMLLDVLGALRRCRSLAGIVVVTADSEVAAIARIFQATVLDDRRDGGQSAAIEQAIAHLCAQRYDTLLALPGDVPLLDPHDIDRLVASHAPAPAVSLVAADGEGGTNALCCSPPDAIALHFGHDSLPKHIAAARAAGIDPVVVRADSLALDVDRPDDLLRFVATRSATHAWRELYARGVVQRIRAARAATLS